MKKKALLLSVILNATYIYSSGELYQPKTLVETALKVALPSLAHVLAEGDTEKEYAHLLVLPKFFQEALQKYLYKRYYPLVLGIFSPTLSPISILRKHTQGVTSVAVIEEYIVTSSMGDTAKLWNINDLSKPIATLIGHTDKVESVAFSPNGNYIATGSSWDNKVNLWDIKNLSSPCATLCGHTDNVESVAFSPDGDFLITGSRDETAKLWNITNIEKPQDLATLSGHTDRVTAGFSPDGNYIATSSWDNTAKLWDIKNLSYPIATLSGHARRVKSVSFSPKGEYIITSSSDNTARLWDINDLSKPIAILFGHTHWVSSATFSPDGNYIATASNDGTVKLWDINYLSSYTATLTTEHGETVSLVRFSPNGNHLITCLSNGIIEIWDIMPTFTLEQLLFVVKLSIIKNSETRKKSFFFNRWYLNIFNSFDLKQKRAIVKYFDLNESLLPRNTCTLS